MYSRREFERKEREDVFGGPGEWDNADKTSVQCPKEGCNGNQAAYFQVQIRSADEPMTSFYKVPLYYILPLRGEMGEYGHIANSKDTVHDMRWTMERELEE